MSSARKRYKNKLVRGLEPGRPVSFDPDYAAAQGPAVEVLVRWHDAAGRPQQRRGQRDDYGLQRHDCRRGLEQHLKGQSPRGFGI